MDPKEQEMFERFKVFMKGQSGQGGLSNGSEASTP